MHENVSAPPADPIRSEDEFEQARELARELRGMAKNADVHPGVLLAHLELCESTHLRVKYTLEHMSESDDLASLLELHELLNDSLSEAKKVTTKLRDLEIQPLVNAVVHGDDLPRDVADHHRHHHCDVDTRHTDALVACKAGGPPLVKMKLHTPEIDGLVNKRDIFSLICLLRGHHNKRLAAAFALMR